MIKHHGPGQAGLAAIFRIKHTVRTYSAWPIGKVNIALCAARGSYIATCCTEGDLSSSWWQLHCHYLERIIPLVCDTCDIIVTGCI